jgi:GPI-anchor transamidase subunit T
MATPSGRVFFLSLSLLLLSSAAAAVAAAEEFTEELLLRPLPDCKTLAHFHFRSLAPASAAAGRHHHLFPKTISQLVRAHHLHPIPSPQA